MESLVTRRFLIIIASLAALASARAGDPEKKADAAPVSSGTFWSRRHGFSLAPPPGFHATDSPTGAIAARFIGPERERFVTNVNVLIQRAKTTRKAYRDASVADVKKGGGEVKAEKELTISGHDALLLDYELSIESVPLRFLSLGVVDAERVVIVTCTARFDDWATFEPGFLACVGSLALFEPVRTTWRHARLGCSLEPPDGWAGSERADATAPAPGKRAAVAIFREDKKDPLGPSVNVQLQGESTTRDEYRKAALAEMSAIGAKVSGEKELTISGHDAWLVEFQGSARGKESHSLSLAVFLSDQVWIVTGTAPAERFASVEKPFRECLASFELGEATAPAGPR